MTTATRLLALGALLGSVLLGGCASAPPPPPMPSAADLFSDTRFQSPTQPVRSDQLFALSAPMRAHLDSEAFRAQLHRGGAERGLFEALYKKGDLKLEYDAAVTRDAAGTFAARKGNCLSLVIMTAAFAKALGLDVIFQTVLVDEQWSRFGNIYVASTHVNLALPLRSIDTGLRTSTTLTIDFMPSEDAASFETLPVDEQTIAAMYLNNRAAEELAGPHPDDAYWFARAAIERNPSFLMAYNTLGVVYQRHGDLALAERVYKRALEREPEHTVVMHNLVPVLAALGKQDESRALAERLAHIEPTPPFFYFQKGMTAMQQGRYADARALFAREVKRSPYNHEFHFWLAIAHLRLGEARAADAEIARAIDTSTSDKATELYSAKLAYLRAQGEAHKRVY
jgi:tetratricopeptide (TPR) repeat protein